MASLLVAPSFIPLMPFIRRFTAALSSVLLLQLALSGSGTLCAMHGDRGADRQAHAMGAMTSAAVANPMPNARGAFERGGAPAGSGDCQLPSAPGQCATMTTCTTAAAPAPVAAAQLAVSLIPSASPEPASMRSRPLAAPELPPPRA
jgi:hypothetical protein